MHPVVSVSILLLCLSVSGCQDPYQEMRHDAGIQRHFDRNQSKDLVSIVKFFDLAVCRTVGRNSLQGRICYLEWFDSIDSSSMHPTPIDLDKDEQWAFSRRLYQSTIEALWTITEPDEDGLYDHLPTLTIHRKGAYLLWLKQMAKEDESVRGYYNLILNKGYTVPETNLYLYEKMTEWSIADPRYRLIIAIHVLTLRSQDLL